MPPAAHTVGRWSTACQACAHESSWEVFLSPDALVEPLLQLPLFFSLPFMLPGKRLRSCHVQHQLSPLLCSLLLCWADLQTQPHFLTVLEVRGAICLAGRWVRMRAWYLYEGPGTGRKKQIMYDCYRSFPCHSRGKWLHFFHIVNNTFLWR